MKLRFSIDLKPSMQTRTGLSFSLNNCQYVIDEPNRYFVPTLQKYSWCNYQYFPTMVDKDKEVQAVERGVKWFDYIPPIEAGASIANLIKIRGFGIFSGLKFHSVSLF